MSPTTNGTNGAHSSNPINKILILGDNRRATSILAALQSNKDLEIHQAISQHSSTTSTSPNHTIHTTDFQPQSLKELFHKTENIDIIFSLHSPNSYEFQKSLIDLAIETGIRRFVPAEWGQDLLNPSVRERLGGAAEERFRVIEYLDCNTQAGVLEYAGIATGYELDTGLISGNLGFDIGWKSATITGETGDEKFAASSTSWLGKLSLALLSHWADVKNTYVYAPGLITTSNSILSALQSATSNASIDPSDLSSTQEWTKGMVEVEETLREAERRIDRGFPDAAMFLFERSVLFDEDGGKGFQRKFLESGEEGRKRLGMGGNGEELEGLVKKAVHDLKHYGKGGCGCD